ncbi:hypothetical protein SUGI_0999510 [Cryptomeria japonica]|nr:hypothetical protein SUGI_0999510 [Cryptomeria japonica]
MKSECQLAYIVATMVVVVVINGGRTHVVVSCFMEFILCLPFVSNNAPLPMQGCCNGFGSLQREAKSSEQRQELCECIHSIAIASGGFFNWAKDAKLPSLCRVNLDFPLDPCINCSM